MLSFRFVVRVKRKNADLIKIIRDLMIFAGFCALILASILVPIMLYLYLR